MKAKMTIFTAAVESGKTTFLQDKLANKAGTAGVLSPKLNGKRHFQLIPSWELLPMESEDGALAIGRYQFDEGSFRKVEDELWRFWNDDSIKTLVIDEIGPLEIKKKQGFHELLMQICMVESSVQKEIIVVVRDYCVHDFIALYEPEHVQIKTKSDFQKELLTRPKGVVLCGGKSKRMKTDKAFLKYNGLPQWQHVYNLLAPFCETVCLSVNNEQLETASFPSNLQVISDNETFKNHGPMTGLLSVIEETGDSPLFLLACDYLLLRMEHLIELVSGRGADFDVVCYRNEGRPEPLITIFESSAIQKIKTFYKNGNDSIATFIGNAKTLYVDVSEADFLQNVNDPEAFQRLKNAKND